MNASTHAGTTRLSYARRVTMLGILTAVAYLVMVVGRIPMVLWLKYDPKDVILIITGFLFGPMSAFLVTLVVSLIEMVTVSETAFYGLIMNVVASSSLVCTAAFVYKRRQTLKGAVAGLITGLVLMVGVMMLWNYIITPLYYGMPREAIKDMLLPVFLPYNLIKGSINIALTMLIYKPLVRALRNANLLPPRDEELAVRDGAAGKRANTGVVLVSLLVLVSCVLFMLAYNGIL